MVAIKDLHSKIKEGKTAKVSFPNSQETAQTAEQTESKLWLETRVRGQLPPSEAHR